MNHTVKMSDEGLIRLPSDVLEQLKPHTRFIVEVRDRTVVLRPEAEEKPFWATATPEEWVKDFHEWVASHKGGPGLSDEAVSRESMYD